RAFVGRLYQDGGVAARDQPIGDVADGGRLVEDALVLAVVEKLDHDDDAVVVGGGDDLVQPVHPRALERSIGVEGGHDPGVIAAGAGQISTGASTLQAYRDQTNPVLGVGGQQRHELIRVELRIPRPGIRTCPLGNRV